MTDKSHKRMGPAPIDAEGEYLCKPRQVRFGPKLTKEIDEARGKGSFAAWIRWAARRALGLPENELGAGSDQRDDDGRQDPSAPTAV